MFCGECGNENKKGALFCEKCGNKLNEEKPATNKVQLSKKQKIGLLVIVAIIAVLGIGYKVCSDLTSPKAVAEKYLKALSNNNYDYIYNCLDIEGDNTFVSKKIFSDILKEDSKDSIIEQYKVTDVTEGDLNIKVRYKYTVKGSSSEQIAYLTLVKQKNKKFLIFDNWKVVINLSSSDTFIKNYKLKVDKGAKLTFGDVKVDEKYLSKDDSTEKLDVYVLPQVFTYKTKVKVELANGLSFEKDVTPSNYYNIVTVTFDEDYLSSEQKNELITSFKTILTDIYSDILAEKNFDDIESKYKRDGLDLSNAKTKYNSSLDSISNASNKLTAINFKEATIYDVSVTEKGYLKVELKITYDYTIKYKEYGEEEEKSLDKNTYDYFTLTLGYNDAKYYLADINNIETYFSRY